jgi:hypothetical protein
LSAFVSVRVFSSVFVSFGDKTGTISRWIRITIPRLNYFTGSEARSWEADLNAVMPSGTYRIVDDQLYQIIEAPRSLREGSKKS